MTEPKLDFPLRTTRAAALREYARARGATGFLGLAFSGCRACDARRIADRVAQAASGARRVGTLVGPKARYEVFTRGNDLRPIRLVVGLGSGGEREILAADRRPPGSAPPAYLAQLELFELEEELKSMNARLVWEPTTMTSTDIDAQFPDRRHLLYIPVSTSGTPLKVGETVQPMKKRYPGDRIAPGKGGVAAKYWVAKVLVEDTRPGHGGQWIPAQKDQMQDVEYLVARRLSRGGATLPLHSTRKGASGVLPLHVLGDVKVANHLPPSLHLKYTDNPKDPRVATASTVNDLTLTTGSSYELLPT
jgi:hypothetical protein